MNKSDRSLIPDHQPAAPRPGEAPEVLAAYLAELEGRYTRADFDSFFAAAYNLKVLVVGETIIDEYAYCETIGKSGKEPILAARYISSEKFPGGVLAIANHLAGFCSEVGVLSCLGAVDPQRDFIEKNLTPGVKRHFIMVEGEPTITKRRYIEVYPVQKLFEVYHMNHYGENPATEEALCRALSGVLSAYDVVVVADYGHGMIGPRAVEAICDGARFLAVNTQVNAENRGFNTVSKYRQADYICVSENEIRLEARSRTRDLQAIITEVAGKMGCPRALITRGSHGCLCYDQGDGFHRTPAFTQHYLDRIGAGDAVLGITSPLVKAGLPPDMLGVVGNVIGALAVAVIGNKEPVTRQGLFDYLEALLKKAGTASDSTLS